MGPYSGLELMKMIMDFTNADVDQNHLSIAQISVPSEIPDRTSFIMGNVKVNPAYKISEVILTYQVTLIILSQVLVQISEATQ